MWHFDSGGNLRGEWDYARLRQVLSNLISNAMQHGDEGAAITVAARGEGECVKISIHNRGPAIPANVLPQIFDPFVRAKPKRGSDRSIGLGLYIAREIVVAHGGQIEVTSTQERGTTFTIILPRSGPHIGSSLQAGQ